MHEAQGLSNRFNLNHRKSIVRKYNPNDNDTKMDRKSKSNRCQLITEAIKIF